MMKVAVIQLNSKNDKKQNIERALTWIHYVAKKKAEFILLPEAFNFRGKIDPRRGYWDVAEKFPGPSTAPIMEAARKHGVSILAGSICERHSSGKKVYNSAVLINARGKIIGKYRKNNLFTAKIGQTPIQESKYFSKGNKNKLVKVGKWSVGLSICYDLRFPGFYQKYAKAGADILCVPSVFTRMTGKAHWEVLLRARAVENLCYVLAPNQAGKDGQGVASYGNSMIISPWGEILARASGNREEVIFAYLSRKELKKWRKILPGNY